MKAARLLSLPPYLFEDLENRCRAAVADGRDVIDLSIGDPDLPPPAALCSRLSEAAGHGDNHRYPPQRGKLGLKAAIRRYLARRCGAAPDDDELLVLVGSKEGLAHLPWAICNPGDVALIPDPAYPVYGSAARFAGCELRPVPLDEPGGYLPDFRGVGGWAEKGAKVWFLNYPNNPTGATAEAADLRQALAIAERHGTVVVNDAAYADVYFGDEPPPLLCGQPGALRQPVVEFFSFSKSFSITGWRLGFAVGRRDLIESLAHLKANIDSGAFGAVQDAVAETLDGDGESYASWMRREYEKRRDAAVDGLERLGFQCFPTCATFYMWIRVPESQRSMDFAHGVLDRADVLVTPGIGFGSRGEGYFRIALTQPVARIEEALHRLGRT